MSFRRSNADQAADSYLLWVSSEVLLSNLQDQISWLKKHPFFGSTAQFNEEASSFSPVVLQQWFVLLARERLVIALYDACLRRGLTVSQEVRLEPRTVPYAGWRRLLDGALPRMLFVWSWSNLAPELRDRCISEWRKAWGLSVLQPAAEPRHDTGISEPPNDGADYAAMLRQRALLPPLVETFFQDFLQQNRDAIQSPAAQRSNTSENSLRASDSTRPFAREHQPVTTAVVSDQKSDAPDSGRKKSALQSLNYRSELKRAIAWGLIQNPGFSNYEVCGWLDDEGTVDLLSQWKNSHQDRSFQSAYRDKKHRHKIDALIGKVRVAVSSESKPPAFQTPTGLHSGTTPPGSSPRKTHRTTSKN